MAEEAFMNKNYESSANLYEQILYGTIFSSPSARLNLAHAYFKNGQHKKAIRQYKLLQSVKDERLSSVANSQLGVLSLLETDSSAALESFKAAIVLDPANKNAKANYMFLKARYAGTPDKVSQVRKQKSQVETLKNNTVLPDSIPQWEQEMSHQNKKEQLLKSLKSINMTEDQARAILDAMKTNESQYIYQLRRAQYADQNKDNKKIEW